MSDYTKQLEATIEELQQKLAQAQHKMPHWVKHVDELDGDCVTLSYILEDKLFGYVQYNETVPTSVTAKTKLSGFRTSSVEECKSLVESDFMCMFFTTKT